MQTLFLMLTIVLGAALNSCTVPQDHAPSEPAGELQEIPPEGNKLVLVELFTSEGCSSCPPADRTLAFLKSQQPVKGAEIVTLAFHVDYWDRLGWKDRFSSPYFTRRQEDYARRFKLGSAYTPQMVVDGASEFVGSDGRRATDAISDALKIGKASVEITGGGDGTKVVVSDAPPHKAATVYFAITEDGLSSRVERGENSGKTLEHVSIVRGLMPMGTLAADKSAFEGRYVGDAMDASSMDNVSVVVFVQENESGKIIGVGKGRFSSGTARF